MEVRVLGVKYEKAATRRRADEFRRRFRDTEEAKRYFCWRADAAT